MAWREWYDQLAKPEWTPAPSTIGTIWSLLYPILFATIAFVTIQAARKKIPLSVLLPFYVNLAANLVFTPIQFGLRHLTLASIDIVIVWASILWMAFAIWKHYRWVAILQLPYFIWVTIASVLQLSITWMNR